MIKLIKIGFIILAIILLFNTCNNQQPGDKNNYHNDINNNIKF